MPSMENGDSRVCSLAAETDALAVYLEALMQPVPDADSCDPVVDRRTAGAFACLQIMAGGVILAIPCGDVREVLRPPVRAQAIIVSGRQPLWFAGLCQTVAGGATLVDLAAVIAGGQRPAGHAQAAVVVADGHYALACDVVGDRFDMQSSRVSWRTPRTRRSWLAGIDTARRCALLDIRVLVRQLADEENALA